MGANVRFGSKSGRRRSLAVEENPYALAAQQPAVGLGQLSMNGASILVTRILRGSVLLVSASMKIDEIVHVAPPLRVARNVELR